MTRLRDRIAKAFLFQLDPEAAHRLAIRGLALNVHPAAAPPDPSLRCRLLDLDLPSPVGLAAGFDKNGEAVDGLLKLGFGFVEIGTVTPRPQPGNPKPRMFRLEPDRAIVNRLGFNNDGAAVVAGRLAARSGRAGVVGVNLGANRDSDDRIADYLSGIDAFARLASYLVLNVSSPNTPGLRRLQEGPALRDLLERAIAARDEATNGERATPLLLKIAPDVDEAELRQIAETALAAGIDGFIAANTTLAREGLRDTRRAAETGGLSGRPLFKRSTILLAKLRLLVGPSVLVIGVGGIDSAEAAWTKITAGADLIQIYTGMIYEGPGLAADINRSLAGRLKAAGLSSIAQAVGIDNARWAAMALRASGAVGG